MNFNLGTELIQQNAISAILELPLDWSHEVVIRKAKSKRNLAQNALYWRWMEYLQDEIGETKEMLHLYFKHKYLKRDDISVLGQQVPVEVTTTKLSVKEFTDYLQNIELFVMDKMGYSFPVCDDYREVFRKETK
jgi:hypothetical protein